MATSTPANASSPASVRPVGPAPAITTAWSVKRKLRLAVPTVPRYYLSAFSTDLAELLLEPRRQAAVNPGRTRTFVRKLRRSRASLRPLRVTASLRRGDGRRRRFGARAPPKGRFADQNDTASKRHRCAEPAKRLALDGKHDDGIRGVPPRVLAGLVPAIHAVPPRLILKIVRKGAAWMTGTSPVMTNVG
jgi:hypothetical protein